MEIYGNIESLKGSIEKRYSFEIKKVEEDRKKQVMEIGKELKNQLTLLNSNMKTIIDAEVKKAHSMILSEEKLKAKKEFEEKRESLINKVFKEAEKQAKKIAHTQEYADYVQENMPKEKGFSIIGDSDYYKTIFPEMDIDKNIIGIKFESKGLVYNFTLNSIIDSKKDILRHEVSKTLFN